MWQINAAEKMSGLLSDLLDVDEIIIGGSLTTPDELDKYSDADMEIRLAGNTPIDIKALLAAASEEFAPVFGYEVISHSRKDAIRVCFENGMRFDLVFRYPADKKSEEPEPAEYDSFASKIDTAVNQFWFYASLILAKLGRKDNLIAAHLALEMCQVIIVIQMLQRDNAKCTNIHRFGDGEDVPVIRRTPQTTGECENISLLRRPVLACETADEILSVVFSAAAHMDNMGKMLTELERTGATSKYTEKSDNLNTMARKLLYS